MKNKLKALVVAGSVLVNSPFVMASENPFDAPANNESVENVENDDEITNETNNDSTNPFEGEAQNKNEDNAQPEVNNAPANNQTNNQTSTQSKETKEKKWYQNNWLVLGLAAIAFGVTKFLQKNKED